MEGRGLLSASGCQAEERELSFFVAKVGCSNTLLS